LVEQPEFAALFVGFDRPSGRNHPDDFTSGHPLNIVARMDAVLLGDHFGDCDLVFGSDFGRKANPRPYYSKETILAKATVARKDPHGIV
jgi:hypothetical protein